MYVAVILFVFMFILELEFIIERLIFILKFYDLKLVKCSHVHKRFFPGTLISSINKTDRRDIIEILVKVVLNTITTHVHKR